MSQTTPERQEDRLTIYFPAPDHYVCPEDDCNSNFRCESWYHQLQSLIRHLEAVHKVAITTKHYVCGFCNKELNARPTSHKCTEAPSSRATAAPAKEYIHKCPHCPKSYPTSRGLLNHTAIHRRAEEAINRRQPNRDETPSPQPPANNGLSRATRRRVVVPRHPPVLRPATTTAQQAARDLRRRSLNHSSIPPVLAQDTSSSSSNTTTDTSSNSSLTASSSSSAISSPPSPEAPRRNQPQYVSESSFNVSESSEHCNRTAIAIEEVAEVDSITEIGISPESQPEATTSTELPNSTFPSDVSAAGDQEGQDSRIEDSIYLDADSTANSIEYSQHFGSGPASLPQPIYTSSPLRQPTESQQHLSLDESSAEESAFEVEERSIGELNSSRVSQSTPETSSATVADPSQTQDEAQFLGDEDREQVAPHSSFDCQLSPDGDFPLAIFMEQLRTHCRGNTNNTKWISFQKLVNDITEASKTHVSIQPPKNRNGPRKSIDPQNAKVIQNIYRSNRKRAIRLITQGDGKQCQIDKQQIEDFYTEAMSRRPIDPSLYDLQHPPRPEVDLSPFTEDQVLKKLRKAENSAPGNDRLTFRHWQRVDPEAKALTQIFNTCLKYQKIPSAWKKSQTILIYKKGNCDDPANWRPIAITRTIYRLYTALLADRLTAWIIKNDVLHSSQKGFLPHDGVFEHNYILQQSMDEALKNGEELCGALLDVAGAFPSVPHGAISESLRSEGAGSKMRKIVEDIYDNSTTTFITANGETREVKQEAGIKQGCAISGILFNLAINPIVQQVQDSQELSTSTQIPESPTTTFSQPPPRKKGTTYADDLALRTRPQKGSKDESH